MRVPLYDPKNENKLITYRNIDYDNYYNIPDIISNEKGLCKYQDQKKENWTKLLTPKI